ncbi:MAG TPA: hypothetical protein VLD38_05850 [Nitrosopumilaceae archaeon]|nr:hypothetical protein [Nitrosopumilaceae archaeon]
MVFVGWGLGFQISSNYYANAFEEKDASISKTLQKTDDYAKVSSIIQQWQSSTDPIAFAQKNNLASSDEKILVYIYLDSPESISKLPQEIKVISSAGNIMSSYLSSGQIKQIAGLDFVQRIDLPILATPLSDSNGLSKNNDQSILPQYSYYVIIIVAALIIGGIIYFIKRKNQKITDKKL